MEYSDYRQYPDLDGQNATERNKLILEIKSLLVSNTLRNIAQNTIGEKTKEEYERKMALLHSAQQLPFEYCCERNLCKRTYQTLRAALKHDTVKNLRRALWLDTQESLSAAIQKARSVIATDTYSYKPKQDPTKERRHRESGKISKRRTLKGLPEDWRGQVYSQLCKSTSKYAPVALILHLTGCRPSELVNGVAVRRHGAEIDIMIKGSKCSDINQAGQELRTVSYAVASTHGQLLEKLLGDHQGMIIKIENPNSFQKIYNAAATKAIGKKGRLLTPYSARHQFSADMKKEGYSKVEIAQAMGHQSTRSQGNYGTSGQGRGTGGPRVDASTPVRNPDRSPLRFSPSLRQ